MYKIIIQQLNEGKRPERRRVWKALETLEAAQAEMQWLKRKNIAFINQEYGNGNIKILETEPDENGIILSCLPVIRTLGNFTIILKIVEA